VIATGTARLSVDSHSFSTALFWNFKRRILTHCCDAYNDPAVFDRLAGGLVRLNVRDRDRQADKSAG